MSEPLVTVVVPAFNAEHSLPRCVDSLLNQTLLELLVLIVDDGSTDGTAALADGYVSRDARVQVIHQKNGGCYRARLAGVRAVTTPYFGFVDADDWVEPQMYAHLLDFAQRNDLDIVECDVKGTGVKGGDELFLGREEVFKKVVYPRMWEGRGSNTVWNKLYRRNHDFSTFVDSFFSTWEDLICNLQFFMPATRIGYLHEGLYNYAITSASSVRNFGERNLAGFKETIRVRGELAKKYGLGADDSALAHWIVHNVRNMLMSAVSAPTSSWRQRMVNVRTLLGMPEVRLAKDRLAATGRKDSDTAFLIRVGRFPLPVVVAILRILKLVHRAVRG